MKHSDPLGPARLHVPPLDLLARGIVEGALTGWHRSPFHGYSSEFREHKMYTPGESIRFIDWKVYAKTEKYFIKKFDEETNMNVHFILDVSSSMYYPAVKRFDPERLNKIGFSVVAAAVLSEILRRQRDAVGLTAFHEDIVVHTPDKVNTLHRRRILSHLENLLAAPPEPKRTRNRKNLMLVAERIPRRSLAVLFTDFWTGDDPVEQTVEALKYLRYKASELIIFHVTDHTTEDLLDLPGRPTRFRDLETGEQISLNPDEIRAAYRRERLHTIRQLREAAFRYRMDYFPVDVRTPYREVISAYLQKRLRLH